MRIADKMNYEQVKHNLSKNRTEMADLQNQAATQKRVNKPSDDPVAATRVLAARTDIASGQQFIKNINMAKSFLEYSEQSLGELADALVRAKELAINQANDASANAKSREVVATEVEQIFNQTIQVGNRKLGDRFLFGGFRTTRPPFDPNGAYAGDNGEMKVSINKEALIAMNIPGSEVFLGSDVNVSSSDLSAEGDDIQGARADGRVPVPNLAPAVNRDGTPVGIRGPASADAASGSGDGVSEGGEALDTSNLSSTWQTKGVNVFRILKDLETGLRTNDKGTVQDSLDTLDEAIAQVVLARSKLGSRVMTLNSTLESLQKGQVDAKTMASSLEDTDTFELVSDLNKTESTLKASLATSGKLIQPSLLDFLR
ncbi:MAG: flagellar hook-associated protein FlgL [Bdellovibrionaceae bacterium]|nr:flagellar hook-associated protein FlgL [Pseudobdellovibrionaceae bacterium]